jgi:hypothetical protein
MRFIAESMCRVLNKYNARQVRQYDVIQLVNCVLLVIKLQHIINCKKPQLQERFIQMRKKDLYGVANNVFSD